MIRADYDPKYFRRFLYIGLGCFAFTAWCFYDALIGYPAKLERANVYWTPSDERPGEYIGMEREPWRTIVREKGWPIDPPDQPEVIEHKIQSQYFYAAICFLIAIPCLLKWFLAKGSWVEGDGQRLHTSWGPEFSYDEISKVDKSKWQKKGITRIDYESDGRQLSFGFDDFKFQREPMSQILLQIEAGLKDEQITGGARESGEQKERSRKSNPAAMTKDSTLR